MLKETVSSLIFIILFSGSAIANGEHPKTILEETGLKAFKILKKKSIDPKTGLPKTLDPKLFRGKTRQAYQIAREIPGVLAQVPCFCECEAFGHENLLDCFIDQHGVE